MTKNKTIIALLFFMFATASAHALITSVTLTPLTPADTLSNGKQYYVPGKVYNFRVQAVDPAATGLAWWNNFDINFVGAATRSCTIDIQTSTVVGVPVGIVNPPIITNNTGGIWTNIDFTIGITFTWNGALDFNSPPANIVQAVVRTNPPVQTVFDTRTFNYGICSQIRVMNFAQTGDAADGLVNPWHAAFNVTGRIVYYVPAEPLITNTVESITPNETLLAPGGPPQLNMAGGIPMPIVDVDPSANVSFPVPGDLAPAAYMIAKFGLPASIGNHTWSVRVFMVTGAAFVDSAAATNLNIFCNRVTVTAISFVGGGGRNAGALPGLAYSIRSVNQPGTSVQITAQLQVLYNASFNMVGDTTFEVSDGINPPWLVNIPSGQTVGSVLALPFPPVGAGATTNPPLTYQVLRIYNGALDGNLGANGQNIPGRIVQPAFPLLAWDNADPPGQNAAPFTNPGVPLVTSTATSFTLNWNALNFGPPNMDGDFDTYRIYYKRSVDPTFLIVDRTTLACPLCAAVLGTIGPGPISFTVGGPGHELQPLTPYDFRISALDLFGNEVAPGNRIIGSIATTALTVEAGISDGISAYTNADFNNPDPAAHKVRQTAIKVTVNVVTAFTVPDQVNIIVASNNSDAGPGPPQFGITGLNDDILTLADGVTRFRIPCSKVAPNTYEGFIPWDHQLMNVSLNNPPNIRFIVETQIGGAFSYTGHAPPGSAIQDEWRFQVSQPAILIPWPTRVLNNVMTTRLPCCYPAYFLAADSLVSIKVYDVKGRVIAILADKQFRPGGQNIKDGGWCGRNKDNNRVGPGLYYIHITATSFFGKVVLDKTLKVVVSH